MERKQQREQEKLSIWEKIKERNIHVPLKEALFPLIEQHLHRIEFTKDHLGVRDFLFIAEKETGFSANLFCAIDMDIEREMTNAEYHEAFVDVYEEEPEKVVDIITTFLQETDRVLCLGIGFIESMTKKEDINKVVNLLKKGLAKDQFDGIRKVREFPKWYETFAVFPEEVEFETKSEEKTRRYDTIMERIDTLLSKETRSKEDEEEFTKLAKAYKQLKEKTQG